MIESIFQANGFSDDHPSTEFPRIQSFREPPNGDEIRVHTETCLRSMLLEIVAISPILLVAWQ